MAAVSTEVGSFRLWGKSFKVRRFHFYPPLLSLLSIIFVASSHFDYLWLSDFLDYFHCQNGFTSLPRRICAEVAARNSLFWTCHLYDPERHPGTIARSGWCTVPLGPNRWYGSKLSQVSIGFPIVFVVSAYCSLCPLFVLGIEVFSSCLPS